jgi:hypothetical protein
VDHLIILGEAGKPSRIMAFKCDRRWRAKRRRAHRHAGVRSFAILAFVNLNQRHLTLGFAIL